MYKRWIAAAVVLGACGSSSGHSPGPDAVTADGSSEPDAPSGFVEAPHPTPPVVKNAGGAVLTAPKVVPVFFHGDTSAQATLEQFLQAVHGSSYWTAISAEYGVGGITIAPSVIATETPPTTDDALAQLVTSHAGGTGGWPANDANTIYAVFLPEGVTLSMGGGTSCVDFGGYHSETQSGVVYAAMPRCNSMTFPGLEYVTIAASHELLEASTDPHPYSQPAYATVDDEDGVWGLVPGAELGDMCEAAHSAYQPLLGTFWVQRTWSNASAAAGHDPCVPVLPTPYVEAATNLQDIAIMAGGQSLTTRGIKVAVGQSVTVEVDLYSDAPTTDWMVSAVDVAQMRQQQPELSFSFDKTTGNNGDKLKLTITRLRAGSQFGISELGLRSQVNGATIGTWWALATQ
jgi:hypothetical protein